MHTIYLGYSDNLSSREMMEYFDIDIEHPDRKPKFERDFGTRYVEMEDFEIYGPDLYKNEDFNEYLFAKLLPFSPDSNLVREIDFSKVKSVLFIKNIEPKILKNENLTLIGPMELEEFDY